MNHTRTSDPSRRLQALRRRDLVTWPVTPVAQDAEARLLPAEWGTATETLNAAEKAIDDGDYEDADRKLADAELLMARWEAARPKPTRGWRHGTHSDAIRWRC